MYPSAKSRSKDVLGGFMDKVILRSRNSGFQPFENIKRSGCRVETSRHDDDINGANINIENINSVNINDNNTNRVILRSRNSGSQPFSIKRVGFTLIELLVVVLIIGILTAVALPQYEAATEKARAAEPLAVLRTVRDAQELYYMANGAYADDLSVLDVQIPQNSKYWSYHWSGVSVWASRKTSNPDEVYLLAYRMNESRADGSASIACGCSGTKGYDYAKRICKALGAVEEEKDCRWILTK